MVTYIKSLLLVFGIYTIFSQNIAYLNVHIDKHLVLYGESDWKSMSVMSCVYCRSQEPQIKAGVHWPAIEGTRKHFLVCSLTQLKIKC